ncbi:MAG TPA: hypothetical protein VEL76_08655 [Gemmataceae bacterium]|nr:hypothetical protein [Gemmataceae bacterium]
MRSLRGLVKLLLPATWFATFRLRHFLLDVLIAVSLAFLVWLYAHTRGQETLDMILIPVQITLAPGIAAQYDLEVHGPNRIPVSFTGGPSRIRELRGLLQHGTVVATTTINIPEERQKDNIYRDTIEIQDAAIPVPPGVMAVVTEGRNQIPVTLHRLSERHLPVRLEYAGEPRISQVKVEPATVLVRGPKAVLDRTRSLPTQPYVPPLSWETGAADGIMRGQASLVSELEGRPVQVSPGKVSIRFRIQSRQKIYDLTEVPIQFLCPPDCSWLPRLAADQSATINLRVLGPTGEEPPSVQAYIDLTRGNHTRGRNVEPLRVQLPRDFQLTPDAPPRIAFDLEPVDKGEE